MAIKVKIIPFYIEVTSDANHLAIEAALHQHCAFVGGSPDYGQDAGIVRATAEAGRFLRHLP
jgi:hypothetical protein